MKPWISFVAVGICLSCGGCAPRYSHFAARPADLRLLHPGSTVSLCLKNATTVQGAVIHIDSDKLIVRSFGPAEYFGFSVRPGVRASLHGSVSVARTEVVSLDSLVQYDPSQRWAPYKRLEGGVVGFGIGAALGAALIGLLWILS